MAGLCAIPYASFAAVFTVHGTPVPARLVRRRPYLRSHYYLTASAIFLLFHLIAQTSSRKRPVKKKRNHRRSCGMCPQKPKPISPGTSSSAELRVDCAHKHNEKGAPGSSGKQLFISVTQRKGNSKQEQEQANKEKDGSHAYQHR